MLTVPSMHISVDSGAVLNFNAFRVARCDVDSICQLMEKTKMTSLYIIFGIIAFVVPAVCILGDNGQWNRKE